MTLDETIRCFFSGGHDLHDVKILFDSEANTNIALIACHRCEYRTWEAR